MTSEPLTSPITVVMKNSKPMRIRADSLARQRWRASLRSPSWEESAPVTAADQFRASLSAGAGLNPTVLDAGIWILAPV